MSAVMVDTLKKAFSRDPHARFVGSRCGHLWCHLWCNPGDEEALHVLAESIGLKRAWFQDKPGFPHYDLVPSKRDLAIQSGATETDLKVWIRENRR